VKAASNQTPLLLNSACCMGTNQGGPMFGEAYLMELIPELEGKGVVFGPGLTDQEIEGIQRTCALTFPSDLRALLQYALPIEARGPYTTRRFPDWRGNLKEILSYIEMMTLGIADYLKGEYELRGDIIWCDLWGENLATS
jgi:hypothetical protein